MKDLLKPLRLLAMLATLVFAVGVAELWQRQQRLVGRRRRRRTSRRPAGPRRTETKCGMAHGEKATGTPIKVGSITTKIPGIDFTDGSDAAAAYFKCVNDNGGINGHPVDFIVEEHGTDPQQVASLADEAGEYRQGRRVRRRARILDCPVNHGYYEKNDFYPIVAGVPNECFNTPNIAALNMGPCYSSLGAVRYVDRQAARRARWSSCRPSSRATRPSTRARSTYAKEKGLKAISRLENGADLRSRRRSCRRSCAGRRRRRRGAGLHPARRA